MRPAQRQAAHAELAKQLRAGGPVPCRVAPDPEAWWSQREGDAARSAAAVAACRSCRVRVACRDYGMLAGEEFGVWGGLTPVDRGAARHGGRT